MGDGDAWGELFLGFIDAATPRFPGELFARAGEAPGAGEPPPTFADPN
jgi:hypothetical protein